MHFASAFFVAKKSPYHNISYKEVFNLAYNRFAAVRYARRWAFRRNPAFYNFDELGGDCTNFVSQCVFAGSGVMNFSQTLGWYYISPDARAPSWTSVQFFYDFMTQNEGAGPYGIDAPLSLAQPGDVMQFAYGENESFSHTLLVVAVGRNPSPENILLAAHTNDAFARPMSTYDITNARLIHIEDVRGQ
ncbi:MAG: amidase domain-containing protein [Oscillospiraceae bacterium]|nr:amidase domain-containing protein [Oscillospiraceae bacterium]